MNHELSMRQVAKDEFFAALKSDPRDIMPFAMGEIDGRLVSEWRTNDNRRSLFGRADTDGNSDNRFWIVAGAMDDMAHRMQ